MASLLNSPDAFKLYDVAVKYVLSILVSQVLYRSTDPHRLAVNNDWLLEEGLGLFLVCSSHAVDCLYSYSCSKDLTSFAVVLRA